MLLKWFQKSGHKPIVLLGGGTSLVGDPSGKDESRKLINEDIIKSNSIGIKDVFNKFLNFDQGDNKALMVDNAEWLKNLNYIEFLRDYGKHFSINRMLTFDSVKLRLDREQTLSFLEFNYMILQAYDFYELNKRYGYATGGRVGLKFGTKPMMPTVAEAPKEEVEDLSYTQLRSRLPQEISNGIVQFLANSKQALLDLSLIHI